MIQWLTAVIDGRVCKVAEAEYEAIRHGTEGERDAALTAAYNRELDKPPHTRHTGC